MFVYVFGDGIPYFKVLYFLKSYHFNWFTYLFMQACWNVSAKWGLKLFFELQEMFWNFEILWNPFDEKVYTLLAIALFWNSKNKRNGQLLWHAQSLLFSCILLLWLGRDSAQCDSYVSTINIFVALEFILNSPIFLHHSIYGVSKKIFCVIHLLKCWGWKKILYFGSTIRFVSELFVFSLRRLHY